MILSQEVKMSGSGKTPNTALPKGWSQTVRSAVLHAIALVRFGVVSAGMDGGE